MGALTLCRAGPAPGASWFAFPTSPLCSTKTPSCERSPSRRSVLRVASFFVIPLARGAATRSGTGDGSARVPLWLRPRGPGAVFMPPSGVPFVPTFPPSSVYVSFPDGSEYALFSYKYADLLSLNRPIFSDTLLRGRSNGWSPRPGLSLPPALSRRMREKTLA